MSAENITAHRWTQTIPTKNRHSWIFSCFTLHLAPKLVLISQKENITHIELHLDQFYRELDSSRNTSQSF